MNKFKNWISFAVIVLLAGIAYAAVERVDKYGGGFPVWFNKGLYVGPDSPSPTATTANKVTRLLSASGTVDFASTRDGRVESSAITVTGAQAGDSCTVGENATAGALAADYSCYVSAANAVKIRFQPKAISSGVCTLDGGSPSQCDATVTAGSVCTCSIVGATAAKAAGGCAVGVTSTTLTATSANSLGDVVNYNCSAPVDPASSTFYVYVRSAQ